MSDSTSTPVLASSRDAPYERYGWKIHLNVPPEPSDPVTNALARYCEERKILYKIGRSDNQEGKGITIYLGGYSRMVETAQFIEKKFGKRIPMPGADAMEGGVKITPHVYARFDAQDLLIPITHPLYKEYGPLVEDSVFTPHPFGNIFHQYGSKGISFLNIDTLYSDLDQTTKITRAHKALSELLGEYYHGGSPRYLLGLLQESSPFQIPR